MTSDSERFRSIENLRYWLLRGIAQARRQMENRPEDLRKAEQLGLVQPSKTEALRGTIAASMAEAEENACLANSSLPARVRCLARLTWSSDHWREFPQNAFLTLAPRLYLKYKQRKR